VPIKNTFAHEFLTINIKFCLQWSLRSHRLHLCTSSNDGSSCL